MRASVAESRRFEEELERLFLLQGHVRALLEEPDAWRESLDDQSELELAWPEHPERSPVRVTLQPDLDEQALGAGWYRFTWEGVTVARFAPRDEP